MYIIGLQTVVIILCLSWVAIGIALIKSGNNYLVGREPIIKCPSWEQIFYEYRIWRWLFGGNRGAAYKLIWTGIASILVGLGILLILIIDGFLFG